MIAVEMNGVKELGGRRVLSAGAGNGGVHDHAVEVG